MDYQYPSYLQRAGMAPTSQPRRMTGRDASRLLNPVPTGPIPTFSRNMQGRPFPGPMGLPKAGNIDPVDYENELDAEFDLPEGDYGATQGAYANGVGMTQAGSFGLPWRYMRTDNQIPKAGPTATAGVGMLAGNPTAGMLQNTVGLRQGRSLGTAPAGSLNMNGVGRMPPRLDQTQWTIGENDVVPIQAPALGALGTNPMASFPASAVGSVTRTDGKPMHDFAAGLAQRRAMDAPIDPAAVAAATGRMRQQGSMGVPLMSGMASYGNRLDAANAAVNVNAGAPGFREPTTYQFAQQQPAGPQYTGLNGRPALNDPETLNERALAAAKRLGTGNPSVQLNMRNPVAEMSARGLSPQVDPVDTAWALQGSASTATPRTTPEQIAANKAKWAQTLADRRTNWQANRMAVGDMQTLNEQARAAGIAPHALLAGQMQQRNAANQLGMMDRQMTMQATDSRLGRESAERIAGINAGAKDNDVRVISDHISGLRLARQNSKDPREQRQLDQEIATLNQRMLGMLSGGQEGATNVPVSTNAGNVPQLNQPSAQEVTDAALDQTYRGSMGGWETGGLDTLKKIQGVIESIPDNLQGEELKAYLIKQRIAPDVLDSAEGAWSLGMPWKWGSTGGLTDAQQRTREKIRDIKRRMKGQSVGSAPTPLWLSPNTASRYLFGA